MNRQMILMALVSAVIILILIIPAFERVPGGHRSANEGAEAAAAIEVEMEPTSTPLVTGESDKKDQIPPLNAYLEPAPGGMRLVLDEKESQYVNSVADDATGGVSVHLVEREVYSGSAELGWVKQYNLVVVRPDTARIDTYPLYTEKAIDHGFYPPIVKLMNEHQAMFIKRSKEGDAIEYQLAVVFLGSGSIYTMPTFWKIHADSEDERDFLLSAHYEWNEDGHIVEVMLTSYGGKRWQMNLKTFKLIGDRGQTYPGAGDPGSSPPRPLMYPTPDLERFVYRFTEKVPIYISNHFMVTDSKSGKVIKLFSIDDSLLLSNSGPVWNKESSRFYLEYAKSGEEMGVVYDTGTLVFAQQIAFYDANGERSRILHAAKGERISVFNWLDEHRLLVESYRPVQRANGGWSKGEIAYKEYDVRTGKLTAYRHEQDASKLANGETLKLCTAGGTYDSKAFVYIDQKHKKVWTPDVKGWTYESDGNLYINVYEKDNQGRIFKWDSEERQLQLVHSYSSSDQTLHQAIGGWLMLGDRGRSSFLYLNTEMDPERNAEGLPVLWGNINRFSFKEWWNEGNEGVGSPKILSGNEVRAKGKSRYGTLRIRSSEGEQYLTDGAIKQYYGQYQVDFTTNEGRNISLPLLENVELVLGKPLGEMKVLSFDQFDLILFQTHQSQFKGYTSKSSNVYVYAVTEGGEATPLTFRYASPGGIQSADSIAIMDQEATITPSRQALILQSYTDGKFYELMWMADVREKTFTLTALRDRTEEYADLRTVVDRYANRLEQALGLTDIALPEGKMDEAKLRSLFTEKAWNNPGFQRLKTDFAKLEKEGNPSRAFAWQPINARYDEYGNIRVTFTFNLLYSIGWAAHLEAILKLDEYEWIFHDFGNLETEYTEGYKELDDDLGMKGYNGLVIPNALER
ncbi:hypothetical protein [Paenibacillus paeoniae]|uniref:Uncharacterized protein n=1 Tax=Paenibacillus paeoniae TaxID=2292705 RepID=A0A371P621_9BACL|nr:hypothetical protein [Paenibacillus paeoniae]REK71403.1 hypothetical protein DX130_20575 [Paenibacillus paeoniae]